MMRIEFSVPAEFEEVPLGMDFDAAWAEVNARSAYGSLTTATDEQRLTEMARALQRISRFLDDSGVVYAANCLHSFEGEPSLGSLAVAVVGYPYGDDAATAARGSLRGVLATRGEGWTGTVIDAPCGKAAVFTGGQSHVLPPTFSPTGEQIEVLTAEFHAMIPVVSEGGREQRMCLIAFSTPQITHWERCYAPVMAGVLRSLRFTEGEQNSADTKSAEASGQSVRF
ncbi:hypothetical protein OG458_12685 [Streptomyces sp. NBC_01281]|uniref:hypothetical protein n=1 Tax=Streptomyces sp. NBC_01281 TaxID=2903811 RepID=UPI002E0F0BAF|nr:hypothetical protein OG458_12685 [Streptomyces sp. NBC_01281]